MIVKLGKPLSSGRTAEIYALDQGKVIKLLYFDEEGSSAAYEAGIIDSIIASGGATARNFGVTKIEDRYGIVLERINGKNIFRTLVRKPWKVRKIGRSMAQLHAGIHLAHVSELREQALYLPGKIELAREILGNTCDQVIEYLNALPPGNKLCHGDFNPKNIIVSPDGFTAVDWADAYSGNCYGDVARAYLILRSPETPAEIPAMMAWLCRMMKKQLCAAYIAEYMKISKSSWQEIQPWLLPMAAAKLEGKISIEEKWLLQVIDDALDKIQAGKEHHSEN